MLTFLGGQLATSIESKRRDPRMNIEGVLNECSGLMELWQYELVESQCPRSKHRIKKSLVVEPTPSDQHLG